MHSRNRGVRVLSVCAAAMAFSGRAALGDGGVIVGGIAGLDAAGAEILASDGLSSLTADQRRRLADRFVAYFEVRGRESHEAYVSLMQGWGGRWRAGPEDDAVRFIIENGWHPEGSPCAISMIDGEGVQCEVIRGIDERGFYAGWPVPPLDRGAAGRVSISVFDFGTGSKALAASGQPVAQVMIPTVERADGTRTLMGVRFLWEPESGDWVPWMLQEVSEPGRSICAQLF